MPTTEEQEIKFLLIDKNSTASQLWFEKESSNLICEIKLII